jgi:hypothetical protein
MKKKTNYFRKVSTFGPLQHRMVISKATLGPLVRWTAINAYRATLSGAGKGTSQHSFSQRGNDISMVISRHKSVKWTFEKFLEQILLPLEERDGAGSEKDKEKERELKE